MPHVGLFAVNAKKVFLIILAQNNESQKKNINTEPPYYLREKSSVSISKSQHNVSKLCFSLTRNSTEKNHFQMRNKDASQKTHFDKFQHSTLVLNRSKHTIVVNKTNCSYLTHFIANIAFNPITKCHHRITNTAKKKYNEWLIPLDE